jgi:hypothetical protein
MLRRLVLLVPIVLLVWFVPGCGVSKGDIERSIRDEMKSKMSVTIMSFDLQKQNDGSYAGTATADNGDVYDVSTAPPKEGKIEWKAIPGQTMVEKLVREGLEKQMSTKVKSLQLTKNGPGSYTGTAELASGMKVTVTSRMDGAKFVWEGKPVKE